jgi:acid phosphatase
MTTPSFGRGWLLAGGGLVLGLLAGYVAGLENAPRHNPAERNLDASVWLQTSGEYRALCLQTYRLAGERLLRKVAALPAGGTAPAVILDLDETVLDNSPFQTWQYQNGVEYSDRHWAVWEQKHGGEVRLVPGARGFIEQAEGAGVTVVYISNRQEKYRGSTVRTLERLGLNSKDIDRRLLLATTTSDKTARRRQVAARHRVLMLLGDNLRDFSEEFRAPRVDPDDVQAQNAGIADRLRQVDARRQRFGDDWIVLPNPTYGEWSKLIGRQPGQNLRQTTMPPP